MNLKQLQGALDRAIAAAEADCAMTQEESEQLSERVLLELRALWGDRVLDAVGESYPGAGWRMADLGEEMTPTCTVYPTVRTEDAKHFTASTPEAARHAAALDVFPTLDRNAPNWPGECP